MFVLSNLLVAVAKLVDILLTIYIYIIIARAIISWVNPDPYNPIVRFLYKATEPLLGKVRRILPDMGGIDLSPLIVMLAIFFIQKFVVITIYDIGYRMRIGVLP